MINNYETKRAMDKNKAEIEANKLANLTGVNHVIVSIGNAYSVYTEKEYPKGYLTLIKPEIKIESIITRQEIISDSELQEIKETVIKEVIKPLKKRLDAVSKA